MTMREDIMELELFRSYYFKNRDEPSQTLIDAETWAEPWTSSQAGLPSRAEPWADPKHQAKASEPRWALSQAKPDPDSRAKPYLSPSWDPSRAPSWAEPSIKPSPEPRAELQVGPEPIA